MRTLVAGALAAAAVGSVVTPAHAVASCLNNPNVLLLAPFGASASCELGPNPPALVYLVVIAGGAVDVDVTCTAGFSTHQPNAAGVATGVIPPFQGICTLTITAVATGTTAVGTIV